MRTSMLVLAALAVLASARPGAAEERIATIPQDRLEALQRMIKPQPGESPWREVAWLTNITEARRRAVVEDKPLVIFTAADGSPLCRT